VSGGQRPCLPRLEAPATALACGYARTCR